MKRSLKSWRERKGKGREKGDKAVLGRDMQNDSTIVFDGQVIVRSRPGLGTGSVKGAPVGGVHDKVAIGLHGAKRPRVAGRARSPYGRAVRDARRDQIAVALHDELELAIGRAQEAESREPFVRSEDVLPDGIGRGRGRGGGRGSRGVFLRAAGQAQA